MNPVARKKKETFALLSKQLTTYDAQNAMGSMCLSFPQEEEGGEGVIVYGVLWNLNKPYDGGVYIFELKYSDYPRNPPHFKIYTPNGVFTEKHAPCISVGAYHADNALANPGVSSFVVHIVASFLDPAAITGGIAVMRTSEEGLIKLAEESLAYNLKNPTTRKIMTDVFYDWWNITRPAVDLTPEVFRGGQNVDLTTTAENSLMKYLTVSPSDELVEAHRHYFPVKWMNYAAYYDLCQELGIVRQLERNSTVTGHSARGDTKNFYTHPMPPPGTPDEELTWTPPRYVDTPKGPVDLGVNPLEDFDF